MRYAAILFRDCEDEYIDPTVEELEKRPKPKKLPNRPKKEPHKPGPDKGTHLNYVTRADTLRHSSDAFWWYPLHQGWKALFYYMFNAILVNAYLLSYYSGHPKKERFTSQHKFRLALIDALFDKAERLTPRQDTTGMRIIGLRGEPPEKSPIKPPGFEHKRKRLEGQGGCHGCRKKRRVLGIQILITSRLLRIHLGNRSAQIQAVMFVR